jgi:hypothetical protein
MAARVAEGADAQQPRALEDLTFALPELNPSSRHATLEEVLERLPNRAAWRRARAAAGEQGLRAFIDPRSGAATNLIASVPLIPGTGAGNRLGMADLAARLGRAVAAVDEATVAELARRFVEERADVLGIDPAELGGTRAVRVSDELWQVSIPQQKDGVPVRDARLALTVNHGNVILMGTQRFARVEADPRPTLRPEEALELGLAFVGGRSLADEIVREPQLELLAVEAGAGHPDADYTGPVARGYRHRLAWAFVFRRAPEPAKWELLVDAHDGRVLSFQDTLLAVERRIRGGVYPLSNTGTCATPAQCGTMAYGWPMPYADTNLLSFSQYADGAGLFNHVIGVPTTTLSGQYFDVVDQCGSISMGLNRLGVIDLGGSNGQTDCQAAGSPGNTPAARTAYYHLNRAAEQARGWLPGNMWLQDKVNVHTNMALACNAYWDPFDFTLNFYGSGTLDNPDPEVDPTCRNTGEIAGVVAHEWGHGLDRFDANGAYSKSTEAYADIAALYRLNVSCIGHGLVASSEPAIGCEAAADGSPNRNEARVGPAHCALNCSGLREADYLQHADGQPDTALGFVCNSCKEGNSVCGRGAHCAAAPVRQAAWDLVARDLQQAPFNLSSDTALLIGTRLFYQGSGNIGDWHACTCGNPSGGSSSGCGATNGYMQWLGADDDNGSLNDGTPHMTALHAAFDRHGIACANPAPVNSGCVGGPTAAPSLNLIAGDGSVGLSWTTVAGAVSYWILRSEGHSACSSGKTLIATATGFGNQYVDTDVVNGRAYSYNVVAKGTSSMCFGKASLCKTVTPVGP